MNTMVLLNFKLSSTEDIHSLISRLIKEKWKFTVDDYTSTNVKIKFNK